MRLRSVVPMFTLLVASIAAHADTVYTYVGHSFTSATAPFTTSDSVTGYFATASPIAPNFSGNISPTSFSFSDGLDTFDSSQSTALGFSFYFNLSTDGTGAISYYDFILQSPGVPQIDLSSGGDTGVYEDTSFALASNNTPGSFTSSAVVTPEPFSLALVGTGMLGTVALFRKRVVDHA